MLSSAFEFMMEEMSYIDATVVEGAGSISLNRPQALNALCLPMMQRLLDLVTLWKRDEGVYSVLIEGQGDRAFCAGGDLRSVHEAQERGDYTFLETLFRTEYTFNLHLFEFQKPYLSLLQGFVMGGGVGASIHGSHRVVCENTVFAMPETGIGYFPDVGGTHFLTRCDEDLGLYVGLTGVRLSPADALYAGFATHFVEHSAFLKIKTAFNEARIASFESMDHLLEAFVSQPQQSSRLQEHRGLIRRCFGQKTSVQAIMEALACENDPFAAETLLILQGRSPLSLRITFKQLKEGRTLSMKQAMQREFAMSQNLIKSADFKEGIRAAVIDKDRNPLWLYKTVEDVPDQVVDAIFTLPKGIMPLGR